MQVDWIPIGECDIQAFTVTEKEALAILNEGKNYFHIAYRLHVSFERAREIVFSIRKKESLIMGKLTNTQRAAIFQAWKDGTTPKELAKQYGVSDQAIYNLINKMAKEPPQELEDVENGIPNTPLVPAAIEKEISVIAEEKSENADEKSTNADAWRLPIVVQDAVNRYIHDIEDEIEMRERRILELQEELDTYRKLYTELAEFRKAYRAKVDAAEEKYEAD
jgi:DNA-binding CsgD family transcriptional regulator